MNDFFVYHLQTIGDTPEESHESFLRRRLDFLKKEKERVRVELSSLKIIPILRRSEAEILRLFENYLGEEMKRYEEESRCIEQEMQSHERVRSIFFAFIVIGVTIILAVSPFVRALAFLVVRSFVKFLLDLISPTLAESLGFSDNY